MLIGDELVHDESGTVRVAVEGCGHGELDGIYQAIRETEVSSGKRVDFLLMCGDLQTLRNEADFDSLAVPKKHKRLGDFQDYYTGKKKAPLLTLFVGGNHEASNFLSELPHGGWVAPNIFYIGRAGCVRVAGLKICGIGGIFKAHDFWKGHFERVPYNDSTVRSVYHVRAYDIFRLSLLRESARADIVISHDWPQGIEHFGDLRHLLARKPFFKQDIQKGELGSPPLMHLLRTLQPRYWFAAHLHVKFAALVNHSALSQPLMPDAASKNPDEIEIDDELDDESAPEGVTDGERADPSSAGPAQNSNGIVPVGQEADKHEPKETRFLALGKCVPSQQFLQVLDIPIRKESLPQTTKLDIEVDGDWLAIVRVTQGLFSDTLKQQNLPDYGSPEFVKLVELARLDREALDTAVGSRSVNHLFGCFEPTSTDARTNPQTTKFESIVQRESNEH